MSNLLGVEVAGRKELALIESGDYDAVLQCIVHMGTHEGQWQGKTTPAKSIIKLVFEIPGITDDEGRSRVMGKELRAVMNERSNFFKFFKAMGIFKEPTSSEVSRVFGTKESMTEVLGTAVSLNVSVFEKNDGTKGNYIESVSKLDSRLPQPEAKLEQFLFAFGDPDLDVFKNKLTSYSRKKIMTALNAKDLPKPFHEAYIAEQEKYAENSNAKATIEPSEAKGII